MTILNIEFVDKFKSLFASGYAAFQHRFTEVQATENNEVKPFILLEENNQFNFPQFFLDHKRGLAKKYEFYETSQLYGIQVTPEFVKSQLDNDIAALELHKEYLRQIELQADRALVEKPEQIEQV